MTKKIILGLAILAGLASCKDDYKEWAQPETNAQGELIKDVPVTFATEATSFDLATVGDSIKLIKPEIGLKEGVSLVEYTLTMTATDAEFAGKSFEITTDKEGKALTSDLTDKMVEIYGKRPTPRALNVAVKAVLDYQGGRGYSECATPGNIAVTLASPVIESVYYVIGSCNGWDINNKEYPLINSGADVYSDPVFTCTVPATEDNVEFKVAPKSGIGDWGKCICAAEEEGVIVGDNKGGNFVIPATPGAATYTISMNMLEQTWSYQVNMASEVWYLVGSCIGDGSWGNAPENIGKALIPLIPEGTGTSSVVVELKAGQGFKLIKTPGNWDDQWGAKDGGFVKNDGGSGNIEVSTDGLYKVSLDVINNVLAIDSYEGTPETFDALGIAGGFNGWGYTGIEKVQGQSHIWFTSYSDGSAQELKFLKEGWNPNWGASDFPFGVGTNGGENIRVAAGDYTIVFSDITGQYVFVQK